MHKCKTLIDGLESCRLFWYFYQLFGLLFWWHPFTAEDPLMSKWCNTTFLQICSDEETNSSTLWMVWGWVHFQQIFIFVWNIFLYMHVKKIQGYYLCSYHFTVPMKGHIVQYLWEKPQLLQNIHWLTSLPTSLSLYTPSCFLPPNPLLCDLIHMSTCDCRAPKGNGVGSRVCQPWIQYLNSFVVNVTTPTCAAVQSSRKTPEPVLLTSASV